jgi:glycosyltransferase involved in cell wall biosynthesis
VLALVRALTELGHQVDLLTFPQGEDVTLPGLTHRRCLALPVGPVRAGPSIAKLLLDLPFMAQAFWLMATGRYDVVHAVEEAAHLSAPLCRLLRLPFVMDVDSSIPDQLRYSGFARRGPLLALARRLERHALRHASSVITVCSSLTEGVRRIAPQARVFQIEDPPLVDESRLAGAQAVAELKDALGLDARPVALYSGNFEPYQGVELLLDAARLLPELQLVLMGGEPEQIETLRRSAEAAGAGGGCVFAGKRPPEQLPVFLALADVVVSPRCRGTNTPFKIYTYLASGRPLVATRIASHTQLLDDSLALLVEPHGEALANGIQEALRDHAAAAARARRGRELIEREHSTTRFTEKVREAYSQVQASLVQRQGASTG